MKHICRHNLPLDYCLECKEKKTMSDTPRTDAIEKRERPIEQYSIRYTTMLDHARTLERELAECGKANRRVIKQAFLERDDAKDDATRLHREKMEQYNGRIEAEAKYNKIAPYVGTRFAAGMEAAAKLLDDEVHSCQSFIDEAQPGQATHLESVRDAMATMANCVRHFAADAEWVASENQPPSQSTSTGSAGLEVAAEATQANSTVNQPSAPTPIPEGWKALLRDAAAAAPTPLVEAKPFGHWNETIGAFVNNEEAVAQMAKDGCRLIPLYADPPVCVEGETQQPIAFMWVETRVTPDSPNGPAEYDEEVCFDTHPPKDGTYYMPLFAKKRDSLEQALETWPEGAERVLRPTESPHKGETVADEPFDPLYEGWNPYCLKCPTMKRMLPMSFGWKCAVCGNEINQSLTHYTPAAESSNKGGA